MVLVDLDFSELEMVVQSEQKHIVHLLRKLLHGCLCKRGITAELKQLLYLFCSYFSPQAEGVLKDWRLEGVSVFFKLSEITKDEIMGYLADFVDQLHFLSRIGRLNRLLKFVCAAIVERLSHSLGHVLSAILIFLFLFKAVGYTEMHGLAVTQVMRGDSI